MYAPQACKLTFFPCINMSLPLWSPEVSTLYLVAFFLCLDKSLPLQAHLVGAPLMSCSFQLSKRSLAISPQCIGPMEGLAIWQSFTPAPPPSCSTIRPGPQCLRYHNSGLISPTSRPDAGRAIGPGKCSMHDRSAPPHLCVSTLALSPSHTAIALPRLGNATSCVAVAAAGGITGLGSSSV